MQKADVDLRREAQEMLERLETLDADQKRIILASLKGMLLSAEMERRGA